MSRNLLVATLLGVVVAGPAMSQTLDSRIRLCVEGTLPNDQRDALIADLADQTHLFTTFTRDKAAACFTKLIGHPAEFIQGTGLVFDEAARSQVQQAKQIAERERQLGEQRAADAEAAKIAAIAEREALRCDLLAQRRANIDAMRPHQATLARFDATKIARKIEARLRTYEECSAWAEENLREALTNNVCQVVFSEIGLPDSEFNDPNPNEVLTASTSLATLEEHNGTIEAQLQRIADEERFSAQYSLELSEIIASGGLNTDSQESDC